MFYHLDSISTLVVVTSPSLNRRRGRDEHIKYNRAKRPMNINRIQMLKLKLTSIHRCIYLQSYSGSNTNTFQHSNININYRDAVNSGTYLLMKNFTHNQLRRCNVPPNHRPACSSISQQRCHPRAGHDSSRTKGTIACLYIAKG